VIQHDHGLNAEQDLFIRKNWARTEHTADEVLDMLRERRDESCAPWCVSQAFETLLLSFSQFESVALLHVLASRLLDQEDLDRGLDAPTPPC